MMPIWPLPKIEIMPFGEISEQREVALVYTQPVWDICRESLHLPVVSQIEAAHADISHWEQLAVELHGDVVYAVGGGLAVDAAKYIAAKLELSLVCLPTALSVDAFLTWASGYRQDGCVRYIETRPPDVLIMDWEVIANAPAHIRAAGVCDVLSIATGCWDWQFAHDKGMNPPGMDYVPYVAENAKTILDGALDCAEAAGQGDPAGLKQLLDTLALEVQLCNLIGHSRPEEGSEHYFAYAVENEIGKGLPHGNLVGPGILLIAELQGQDTAAIKKALLDCQIPLDSIPLQVVEETLRGQPVYCQHHDLPYGLAHTLTEKSIKTLSVLE